MDSRAESHVGNHRPSCFLKPTSQNSQCSQKIYQKESQNITVEKEINVITKNSSTSPAASLKEEESNVEPKESVVLEDRGGRKEEVRVIDVHGVRIRPAKVRFDNTFENQRYTEMLSIQNISDFSVTVRIHSPRAWSYRLNPLERGYLLAPGLKVSRRIHYTCTKNGIVQSTLPIHVNENIIEIPLQAFKGQAFIEIIPASIQFGRVDIGSKPVEKKIRIRNVSSCATKFLVDLGNNELDLHVSPLKGWIRPNNSVSIHLKLLALREGVYSSEFWITTDLSQARVPVEVEACRRKLLVIHPNTISEFTLVDFPMTFFGCRRYQTLLVYNMAASTSTFVVVADYGSSGQEPFCEAKKKAQSQLNMFDIEPIEGKIRPFEKKIFTFWFTPKVIPGIEPTRRRSKKSSDLNDYLCTIRIKRIQVDDSGADYVLNESINKSLSKYNTVTFLGEEKSNFNFDSELDVVEEEALSSASLLGDISLLLYLYGEAEVPVLCATPDALYFPNTPVGSTVVKVVQLTNNTNQLLAFKYSKIPFFEVIPDFKKIDSKMAIDVTVQFCAKNIGDLNKKLIFMILAEENATDKLNFQTVGHVTVRISGYVQSQKIAPKPKFNPGITPLITHEVGFLTDEVTFASKIEKPRSAMTVAARVGRPWHQTDATIAFPNDRPLTLRPRPTDATAKTIFKGLPRYIAPIDASLTYTVEELAMKKANDAWFLKYIQGTAALSIPKERCCDWKVPNYHPDPPLALLQEKELKLPHEVFVPLTFVQLYRISVFPPILSFGSVTTNKSCSQILSICNGNEFKVSAKIVPLSSAIDVQILEHFIISEKSESKVTLTFRRESLGKYNGAITCIINGFHSFDIAVVAEVVYRSLTITPEYVEIKIPDIPFADLCVPVAIQNPLNIPMSFFWVIPDESPIKIEPTHGVAPKLGTVWCGVFFEPENPNYKLYPLKLMVEGSTCLKLKTGVVLPKTNVYFLESVFNVGNIPMNLTTVRRFMVFNPDFSDAMFVFLNKEPIKGVKVIPPSGTIKAKSCHCFCLHITIPFEKPLDFTVYMNLQNLATIEMKVTGNVVYPDVDLSPKFINLHRVPCNSVSRTTLIAENKSKAKAEVNFEMDEYPQFKVSLSKRHHDPGLNDCGFTLESGAIQKFYLHFIPKDLASYDFYLPVIINDLHPFRNSSLKEVEAQGRMIKKISRDENKGSSSQWKKLVMSHLVLINVAVLKELLVFSDLNLFFSVTSEDKTFSVRNASEQNVGILIHPEDLQGPFDVFVEKEEAVNKRDSFKSTLPPGESLTFKVIFTANLPGSYIQDVAVTTTNEEYSLIYNTVRLMGNISFPCVISPSTHEIYFQPVPLNVEISINFPLKVAHKQNEETVISHHMANFHEDLFSIEYPKGNIVTGVTNRKIQVKITFKSKFPVSVRKQVTFNCGRHSACVVMMIATADSCLLTTHAFLKAHSKNQPKLNFIDEVTEEMNMVENEIKIPYKHLSMKQTTLQNNDSSSLKSDQSVISQSTFGSLSLAGKVKRSLQKSQTINPSQVLMEKERKIFSKSDLSILPSEKEEKLPLKKQSLMVTETITIDEEKLMFPMFPLQPTLSENATYMNQTLNSVQQWVYEQVFCCSYNAHFGSHSFSSFSIANRKEFSPSSPVALKNVFDVLERICGRRIRRFFTPIDKLPEDKLARAMFTYNSYRQLVEFMAVQGALMAHIEPKYLMVYDEYCDYQKSIQLTRKSQDFFTTESQNFDSNGDSELKSAENFQSISVQCWLDLFLQIFKTLVLGPAVGITYNNNLEEIKQPTVQSVYTRDIEDKKSLYGRAEDVLLSWLTHHYNSQRTVVWPNSPPPPRTVTNFDSDLEDGLVLTATTAAYCPYLNQIYFSDMCLHPSSISQAYHNATCLCMAWGIIKLGFSISPRDFVHSNTIKMLLLVTHLYKILPSYKPEGIIAFKAILNASDSQIVTLKNDEEVSITYYVQILPNNSNFFLEDCQNSFLLKRKSTGKITVHYMARNTNKVEAILLLCGACMPPKFGQNYVFKLEGYPVKLPVSSSFNIISPQNVPMDAEITVESPHAMDLKGGETCSYDLWVTYTEPQPGNINALCWAKERKRKIPRRMYFNANRLVVASAKGKFANGILSFKVCCYSIMVRDFWLIFRNQNVGDFIVKLRVTPRHPQPVMSLQITMLEEEKCTCTAAGPTPTCNRMTTVKIPCRNLEQWAGVRTMFELSTSPEEKTFWAAYIETNIGFRLLQWMLEEKKEILNKELEELFKKSKTYKVTCASKHVTCPPTLHIPDVRSNLSISVDLHLDSTSPTHSTVLTLTSTDGFEMRCYKLEIVIDSSNPPEIRLSK